MSSPWKDPRTGIYYIRRAVPSELKGQLGGIYRRSLRTKDTAEAKSLFPLELAKSERRFAEARERLTQREVTEISRDEAEPLADVWLAVQLEEDEEYRREGLSERDYDKLQEAVDIVETGAKRKLARGDFCLVEFELDDFLDVYGLKMPKDSPAYRHLAYE